MGKNPPSDFCPRITFLFSASGWAITCRERMKLGIINSAFYQAGVDTATGLKSIARIGFDCVDVHTGAMGISKQEVSLVARTCEKLGLPIVSLPVCSLGLADFVGLDVCVDMMHVLLEGVGEPKYRACPLLEKYVAAGWLGRKSGRGFYKYAS